MNTSSEKKLVSKKGVLVDIVLSICFFAGMMHVCRAHVPIVTEPASTILTAYTALSLTGVFWLALQCARVTWVDQLNNKKNTPDA